MQTGATRRVRAVEQALAVIELLSGAQEPLGVSDIARLTGVPKSTCFALLRTLAGRGYAAQHPDHRWVLGLRMSSLAMADRGYARLSRVAQPALERIASAYGWPAHLAVQDAGEVLYVSKVEPPRFVRFDTYAGKRATLHLTALGKAMAAFLPESELSSALAAHPLGEGRQNAIKTVEQLNHAIATVRQVGYAVEWEEETAGVCCIASPLLVAGDRVVGAIGITALTGEMPPPLIQQVGAALVEAAASLGAGFDETIDSVESRI